MKHWRIQPPAPVQGDTLFAAHRGGLGSPGPAHGPGLAAWDEAQKRLPEILDLTLMHADAPGVLGRAARHHLSGKGKAFRARLLTASAHALGVPFADYLPAAAACELLHNASLVHDDMQDRDTHRRHKTTVWKEFGPDVALCLGDHFISKTNALLAQTPDPAKAVSLIALFSEATTSAIVGQLDESASGPGALPDWDGYVAMAGGKSGALFALPVLAACVLAGLDETVRNHAVRALALSGVAYQVKDDLRDMAGGKEGRPAGTDLAPGKANALVVLALDHGSQDLRNRYHAYLKRGAPLDERDRWLAEFTRPEIMRLVTQAHARLLGKAREHAGHLPPALYQALAHGIAPITALPTDIDEHGAVTAGPS